MAALQYEAVPAMAPERFASVLSPGEYEALLGLVEHAARELHGRVIWNVNSTAKGGGVVEMLRPLLGYCRGAGVDARWAVIKGQPEFFAITKRLHNRLHGFAGDGGPLGGAEREVYDQTLAASAQELAQVVHPLDIVILHDPQTAGLAAAVRETGATVIWRCHVGLDVANDHAHAAWDFLRGYVLDAHAYVFSRAGFAWDGLPRDRIAVIRPSIDAFAPKNAEQAPEQSLAILATAGILAGGVDAHPVFTRSDGTPGRVQRPAEMLEEEPLEAGVPVVMQVSRWDQLKDPIGVLGAFAGTSRATVRPTCCWSARRRRPSPMTPRARRFWTRSARRGTSCRRRFVGACTCARCRWTISRRTRRWSTRSSGTRTWSCRRASRRGSA